MFRAAGMAAVVAAALIAYAPSASYGLFADDFQWLVGAQEFHAGQLFSIEGRAHFFRPVMEAYFPAAYAVCDRSASGYHWLNIGLHAINSVLVAALAAALAGRWTAGVLAGLFFALQPAPTEAVVWVSAATELLSVLFVVLTVWLFWRRRIGVALVTFVLAMMAHETSIVALAFMALLGRPWRGLVPFAIAAVAYLPIIVIVNARNYVFTDGHYAIGLHVARNVVNALSDLAVTGDSTAGTLVAVALTIAAIAAGSWRIRFFALWMLIALLPFAGFKDGMASRYLYLSAVGFSALLAEAILAIPPRLERHSRAATIACGVLAALLMTRSAVFVSKNVRPWRDAARPYTEYAAAVRAAQPAPPAGGEIAAPAPHSFEPHFVPSLLRWEYRDPALRVRGPG